MRRQIIFSDIVDVPSDAMIYSTNVRLALTGGVGAAIVRKFGIRAQIDLQNRSTGIGSRPAEVGEIIECGIAGGPWKRVFHTVAADEAYHTEPTIVRSILHRCFRRCADAGDVRSIACSALGAGYGDLDAKVFIALAEEVCREFDGSAIESFAVVSCDSGECELLRQTSQWQLQNG